MSGSSREPSSPPRKEPIPLAPTANSCEESPSARDWGEELPTRFILPQDDANSGRTWYQGGAGREYPHVGYQKKLFQPSKAPPAFGWTIGVLEATVTSVRPRVVTLTLDSYCPNLTGYEANVDGEGWKKIEAIPSWPLHTGVNCLSIRTISAGVIPGPVFSVRMELAD